MAYACIDPNYGEPLLMADTISESPANAMKKACMSKSCALYSGASHVTSPPLPGEWSNLQKQGYRIAEVRFEVDLGNGFSHVPLGIYS
jgi:hypothetical protein